MPTLFPLFHVTDLLENAMTHDPRSLTAAWPSVYQSPASFNKRRIDRIDEPARPLGAKRAALHQRRLSRTHPGPRDSSSDPGALTLVSVDGTVTFKLNASTQGLLVERSRHQTSGTHLVQLMVFVEQDPFDRWCACEPVRFDDPRLYGELRREGHAVFARSH